MHRMEVTHIGKFLKTISIDMDIEVRALLSIVYLLALER